MKKGKKLYEGKAKIIYATNDKNLVIQYFKDDATAFNNQKKTTIEGKGVLNNRISEHILSNLSQIGIKNHLVKRLNMREQIIKLVEIIPIEFIVRNVATGSITKRLGIEDGTVLKEPLVEYCLKDDKLGDPLISEEHILAFDWASKIEKISSDKGLNMSQKRIVVSTSGIPKMIKKLADENLRVNLALSLHSAIEETRNLIMPFSKKFSLEEIKDSLTYWYAKTKRKVTFEYIVWKDINDSIEHISALIKYCKSITIQT